MPNKNQQLWDDKSFHEKFNVMYTNLEVLRVTVENVAQNISDQSVVIHELTQKVHHLDKHAILREEFSENNKKVFLELDRNRTSIWKLTTWAAFLSASTGAGVSMLVQLAGGM